MPGNAFATLTEQLEAKRLLTAALADIPAHAYLFHGPAGVGKRKAALAFAAELLAGTEAARPATPATSELARSTTRDRVLREAHPDLYVLEPLGDQIRIDEIRRLRRDLHMRPFEAGRRAYLIVSAELMNDEAADALLKDLEEPPPYAVVILVANELGPLPETVRSRCQLVPFRRLSERAVREAVAARAPALPDHEVKAIARVAGGRLDRVERLLDAGAGARRGTLLEVARGVYTDADFEPSAAAQAVIAGAADRGGEARAEAERELERLDLPGRDAEQRLRRAQRGAEREELLLALEELAAWYRDLVVVAVGAERVVTHYDRLDQLREDGSTERMAAAERAAEIVRETWRSFEEFNIQPGLAFEALFIRLRRELVGSAPHASLLEA